MIGEEFGLLSNLGCYSSNNSKNFRQQRLKKAPNHPMTRCNSQKKLFGPTST